MRPPDQIPGESDQSYELFLRWLREIPPGEIHSAGPAAKALGVSHAKLATAKSRFKWIDRRTKHGWDAKRTDEAKQAVVVAEVINDPEKMSQYEAASYQAWRVSVAKTTREIAESCDAAGYIVRQYLSMVADGEAPPTYLRDAAALMLRHFFPPELTKAALVTEEGPGSETQRARALGLDNPARAGENMQSIADRITAAAAISDPRPRKTSE